MKNLKPLFSDSTFSVRSISVRNFGGSSFGLKIVLSLMLGLSFVCSQQAFAESDSPAWAGVMYGLSVPSADSTSSRGAYGLTAGAKLGSEYGLGVYYINSHHNETGGKFDYDLYGVELGYHFEGEAKGAYFGGRLGTSKVALPGISTSPFHWGVFAGYNYMLMPHLSLGGEASFLSVAKSSSSGTDVDGFTTLNFMLTAKFWL